MLALSTKLKSVAKWAFGLFFSSYTRVVVMRVVRGESAGTDLEDENAAEKMITGRRIEFHHHPSSDGREIDFSVIEGADCVCTCTAWTDAPYPDTDIVSLPKGRYMIGALKTVPAHQGKGYATHLIRHVTRSMFDRGFDEGVTVLWHNNAASLSVFEKSGWIALSCLLVLQVKGLARPIRITRPGSSLSFGRLQK